jgi:protein-S-isoprenylcysteine O-methyltransferase Ste14
MTTPRPQDRKLGTALVALQLGLILVLAWHAAPAFLSGSAALGAWVLALAGTALGGWALASNRPGNFNVHPLPREGGHLVQHGPYRWIRHPMYSSVLLFALAAAWGGGGPWGWLGAVALAAVLVRKAGLEEHWMLARHPAYAAYRARSRGFVPGLY